MESVRSLIRQTKLQRAREQNKRNTSRSTKTAGSSMKMVGAWGEYHTDNQELPAYIAKYIDDITLVKHSSIAKASDFGIIKQESAKEVAELHTVGKIDREIYKCITEDIVTDEVIITDERIEHIRERHPNDYERFYNYIPEIINNPDFIIEANKPNTAVILKEIEERGEKFKLVLRIKVRSDPEDYKNSIMTFWHIGETTWRKTLKNKKILYKSE